MPTWNTSPGFLSNATKGVPFSYPLSCDGVNLTYSIIAGSLPDGLMLDGLIIIDGFSNPTIWGNVQANCPTQEFVFTIRATDNVGNIKDRAFSINVLAPEPYYVFPASDLGLYPHGDWMTTSVASLNDVIPGPMLLFSGSLPTGLTLDEATGIINGYVAPSNLYDTPAIYQNIEPSASELSNSQDSKVFSFSIQYITGDIVFYTITIVRSDIFFNGNLENVGYRYADYDIPLGMVDGVNRTFTLLNTPVPNTNIEIYYNGGLINEGVDYIIRTNSIIYSFAPAIGSSQFVFYTYA